MVSCCFRYKKSCYITSIYTYILIYTMIIKIHNGIYQYILVYTSDYPVQKMAVRVTNLYIEAMEARFGHIKWIASGPHHASQQLRLPFHISKGSQGAIHNMGLQDMIELGRSPACAWWCLLIRFVRKAHLILKVLANPLRQLGGQPAQGRVCLPANILQPLWGFCCSFWQGHNGGRVLCKLKSAGLEKVDVKAHTTSRRFIVGLFHHQESQISRCIHVHGRIYHFQHCTSRYVKEYCSKSYCLSPAHISTIQHGNQGGIAYSRLTGDIEITICQSNALHSILVRWNFR